MLQEFRPRACFFLSPFAKGVSRGCEGVRAPAVSNLMLFFCRLLRSSRSAFVLLSWDVSGVNTCWHSASSDGQHFSFRNAPKIKGAGPIDAAESFA